MTLPKLYAGIDVSKDFLDVFVPDGRGGGKPERIANAQAAAAALAGKLKRRHAFAVFEATGRYDRTLRDALDAAGVPYARANPKRVHDFARACGRRAKTDRIDARLLSAFGERMQPAPAAPSEPARRTLSDLNQWRGYLVKVRAQILAQLHILPEGLMRDSARALLVWLKAQIAKFEAAIAAAIAHNPSLHEIDRTLRSAPGVGKVTSSTLIANLPELGAASPKEIASLAGLAPFNHDSGALKGQRCIQGGRKPVRDALYMAALAASRSANPVALFFKRKRDEGKEFKVAIVAAMRKLLIILNAMVRDKKPFAA
jgi:transposase